MAKNQSPIALETLQKVLKIVGCRPTYIVGGFLRDLILIRPTLDIDLATPQDPVRLAKRLANRLGGTAFPLDPERGIHRVQLQGGLRLDLAQFKGPTLEFDLLSRDFTINAMALPLNKETLQALAQSIPSPKLGEGGRRPGEGQGDLIKTIIDPTGGLKDLEKKKMRAVSKQSFKDDPLRILRTFRIAAELNFTIDAATLKLIERDKTRLRHVSKERVREELLKLFSLRNSAQSLDLMNRSGVLKILLPEIKKMETTAKTYYGKGGVWKHSLEAFEILEVVLDNIRRLFPRCAKPLVGYIEAPVAGYPRAALLKLSELLHDVGKPKTARRIGGRLRFFGHEDVGARMARKILERLRFSTEERDRVGKIVQAHMRPGNLAAQPLITDKAIFRFFRDLGDDAIGALLVSLADHLTYVSQHRRLKWKTPHERLTKKMIERFYLQSEKVSPKRLINGNVIMKAFFLPPGPLIGEILNAVQEAQALGQVSNTPGALDWIRKQFKDKLR